MEQKKSSFLKNMVGFSMVTWVSFILGFIASPISTRLFVPAELAKVSLFGSYASLISSVCYLGLDQAFVRFFRETPEGMNRKGLLSFCLSMALGFCVLGALVLSFFRQGICTEIVGSNDPIVFVCLFVYSFSLIIYRFLSLCYRMEQNAVLYTIQGVIYALLTKIAYLSVGFASATGKAALMTLTGLTSVFALCMILIQRKRLEKGFIHQIRRDTVRPIFSYAFPLIPLSVLTWFNTYTSTLVLKHLLGYEAAGIYASALGLASTINIIQTGFNTYWAPYVLENYNSDDSARFFTVHRLMACMLTLFGLCITMAQAPVFLLLGRSYRSSVIFFPFLFLSPICYCLGETTGMGITISKKTYWTTIIYLFSAIANIGFCFLFIPRMGMPGAALSSALTAVLTLLFRTRVGEKYYRVLHSYRYLFYTIGLMGVASFGNLYLQGWMKYAMLIVVLGLALFLFRHEIKTLWDTALQILTALKRRKHHAG